MFEYIDDFFFKLYIIYIERNKWELHALSLNQKSSQSCILISFLDWLTTDYVLVQIPTFGMNK